MFKSSSLKSKNKFTFKCVDTTCILYPYSRLHEQLLMLWGRSLWGKPHTYKMVWYIL